MMLKKVMISTLIIVLVSAAGVAAYDAYQGNSTLDLPDVDSLQNIVGQESGYGPGQGQGQSRGQGQGQGRQGQQQEQGQQSRGQGQGKGGQGQQQGQGRGNSGQGNPQLIDREWQTIAGSIISVDPQTLIVDTAELGQLTLQLGRPGFADQQGVTFNPGDAVTILGFEGEQEAFVAAQITNDATGATLLLRDPNGRPLWAGPGQSQGQAQGQRGQGQNGQPGQANETGLPQAANKEWVTLTGVVVSDSRQGLTVDTAQSGEVMLEMGPPWFAGQQEITFAPGDTVTILGFEGNGGMFQAGQITNDSTGQTLFLRDPNGRPLWAGRGQGGGGRGQG